MLSVYTLLALALTAQAAPTTEKVSTGSFSLPAVHTANRNGTAAMLKAYRKFNLTPTQDFSTSFWNELRVSRKRQDGTAPASPDSSNSEYLVPVTVGGQKLNLDFDSGSADLWVFSTLLPSSETSNHNVYDSSKSSTYKGQSGSTWDISYADGSGASGVCGTDDVSVGSTKVTGQVIELANKVSSSFASGAGDGLLGLAFSSINTVQPTPAKTFFDNAQSGLDKPIFGAYLPKGTDGEYDFGATDSAKFTGSLTYTKVDSSKGFWEYPSTSFKVGSSTGSMDGYTGITDTGTTLVLMADAAVTAYYKQVPGASNSQSDGGYVFGCNTTLPDFSFAIGDNMATIPGSLINFSPASKSGSCFGGIQSVGSGTQNIYGDVFLNANYGVFDASGPSFGFAPSTASHSVRSPSKSIYRFSEIEGTA